MSRRVTTKTEIKDRALAIQALKDAGMNYSSSGSTLRITSGRLANASINLDTGEISGDSDYGHSLEVLGIFQQAYGETKYKAECTKQGITITSRLVEKNGDIRLKCRMA